MSVLLLFLAGAALAAAAVHAFSQTAATRRHLDRIHKISDKAQFSRTLGVMLVVAQFSELMAAIQHLTWTRGILLLVFLILAANARTGTEPELHSKL